MCPAFGRNGDAEGRHLEQGTGAEGASKVPLQRADLLDQQLRRLEHDFLQEGGLRERMTRARLFARGKQQQGGARR